MDFKQSRGDIRRAMECSRVDGAALFLPDSCALSLLRRRDSFVVDLPFIGRFETSKIRVTFGYRESMEKSRAVPSTDLSCWRSD